MLDVNHERLVYLDDIYHGRLRTRTSNEYNIEEIVFSADLVIGAVLIPGRRAPHLVTRAMLSQDARRAPSSSTWPSTRAAASKPRARPRTAIPTYVVDGVVHYCVANMPGAVPRTSTFALNNQTMPFVLAACQRRPGCRYIKTSLC